MVALITVVSLLVAASQATALTPTENILRLARRQTSSGIDPSDFPSACQSGCTSVLNTVEGCTDLACVCTTSNLKGVQSCINCIVSTDSSLQAVGQSVLNTYNTECAGEGVGSLTLGGGTGTAAAGASSTGSSSSGGSSGSSNPLKKGAAGRVGVSMAGIVGAGVVGGIAALF